jgi:hypothetical protein
MSTSSLALLATLYLAAPIPKDIDKWPTVFRGQWRLYDSDGGGGQLQMTLKKDGTLIGQRYTVGKDREVHLEEYRGTWYVKHNVKTHLSDNATCLYFITKSKTNKDILSDLHVDPIKSRDEIHVWSGSRLTILKRMK